MLYNLCVVYPFNFHNHLLPQWRVVKMHLLARLFLSCLLTCNSSSSCKLQPCTGKTFNNVPPLVSVCCCSSFMDLFQEFVGHLQVYLSVSLNWHPRHLLSFFPTFIMCGSLYSWHYSNCIKFAIIFFISWS